MNSLLGILLETFALRALDEGVEHGQRSRLGRIIIVTFALGAITLAGWLLTR